MQAIDTAFQGGPFAPVQTVLLLHLNLSFTNAVAHLRIQGPANTTFLLQASSNLITWDGIDTLTTDSNGLAEFTEPQMPGSQPRFYRVFDP